MREEGNSRILGLGKKKGGGGVKVERGKRK